MKLFQKEMFLLFIGFLITVIMGKGQNINIAVSSGNNGMIKIGDTTLVEVQITNASSSTPVQEFKLRPFISFPGSVKIKRTGLPTGWSLLINDEGVCRFCNGTDVILPGKTRTLFITIEGVIVSTPLTISAQMGFGNGKPNCGSGAATSGNIIPDDNSTCRIAVLPKINFNILKI